MRQTPQTRGGRLALDTFEALAPPGLMLWERLAAKEPEGADPGMEAASPLATA